MDASVQAAVRASLLLEAPGVVPTVLRPIMEELVRDVMTAAIEATTEGGVRRVRLLNTVVNQVEGVPVPDDAMPVLQRATFTTFLPNDQPQHNPLLYGVE